MSVRELSFDEIAFVSGGESMMSAANRGNTGGGSLGRNAPSHIYSDPSTTNCGNGIVGGTVAGTLGGFPGMAVGALGGAIAGGCFSNTSNKSSSGNGCNSGSNKCGGASAAGTCSK